MGERSIIVDLIDHNQVGAVYYHRSANTESTIKTIAELITGAGLDRPASNKDCLHAVLRYLQKNGGGMDPREIQAAQSRWPGETIFRGVNRANGLLSISRRGMLDTDFLSSGGGANVYLDTRKVYFAEWSIYSAKDGPYSDFGDPEEREQALINIELFPWKETDFLPHEFRFRDLPRMIDYVESRRTFVTSEGFIYKPVE